MRRVLLAIVLTIWLAVPVWADYQAGLDAYKQGDHATALHEWKPLAEGGTARAQYALGILYAKGRGVPKDLDEALKWYRKAAEQGYGKAQSVVGLYYEKGRGVSKDTVEALRWYRKAAAKGVKSAKKGIARLEGDPKVARQIEQKRLDKNRRARQRVEEIRQARQAANKRGAEELRQFKERGSPKWCREKLAETETAEVNTRVEKVLKRAVSRMTEIADRDFGKSAREMVDSMLKGLSKAEMDKDLTESEVAIERYLCAHPDNVSALLMLARVLFMGHKTIGAVLLINRSAKKIRAHAALDRAISLAPTNAESYYLKARLYGTYQAEKAISFLKQAVELIPQNPWFHIDLAIHQALQGRFVEAEMQTVRLDGKRHPISVLLENRKIFPLPQSAAYWPFITEWMKQMYGGTNIEVAIRDFYIFRVAAYAVPMPLKAVERFYRERITGLPPLKMNKWNFQHLYISAKGKELIYAGGKPADLIDDVNKIPPGSWLLTVTESGPVKPGNPSKPPVEMKGNSVIISVVNLRSFSR